MAGFSEQMRLRGKADEDLYFARRERELIDALHRAQGGGQEGPARAESDSPGQAPEDPPEPAPPARP